MDLYKNKKTGKIYRMLDDSIINTTNAQNGQKMIEYALEKDFNSNFVTCQIFVREEKEFYEKFEEIK